MNVLKKKDPYQVYILICFLSQLFFTFIFTVNLLYQVQIVKLDPFQLVIVGSVLEAVVFLFEIPTGVVSDMKSRKLSIIIGYFLIGIGFFLEGSLPYFSTVMLCQIFWGIGYTFTSGSVQAWIADEIGEERVSLAFVRGAKAGNLGKIIAIPLSIVTGYEMISLPIMTGGICMIGLSLFLIYFMKEEKFIPTTKRVSTWKTMKGNLSAIFYYSKANYFMRILFLIALFFGLYSEGFDRLWISHFFEVTHLSSLPEGKLVVVTGGIEFIVVLSSFAILHLIGLSPIHQHLKHIYLALLIGSSLIITSLIGFALLTQIISLLVFYIIIQVTRYAMYPLEDVWLNKIIPDSSNRATFFSVKGQVDAIGQISGGPVIGFIASSFTIKIAMLVSALLLTPVLFLYSMILKKLKG